MVYRGISDQSVSEFYPYKVGRHTLARHVPTAHGSRKRLFILHTKIYALFSVDINAATQLAQEQLQNVYEPLNNRVFTTVCNVCHHCASSMYLQHRFQIAVAFTALHERDISTSVLSE